MKKYNPAQLANLLAPLDNMDRQQAASLLEVLVKNLGRQKQLTAVPRLVADLQRLLDQKNQILRVKVQSHEPLNDELKNQLTTFLHQKFGAEKRIIWQIEIMPDLVGLTVQTPDQFFDLSSRGQIKQLRQILAS